jgi:hypothetical protein
MSFFAVKSLIISLTLGAAIATSGYLLSTASYVGSSMQMVLEPKATDLGTMWIAQNDDITVEVRYISSLIETPSMTIRKKQQWPELAISLASGILVAYGCYRVMMRKDPNPPSSTSSSTSHIPVPAAILPDPEIPQSTSDSPASNES